MTKKERPDSIGNASEPLLELWWNDHPAMRGFEYPDLRILIAWAVEKIAAVQGVTLAKEKTDDQGRNSGDTLPLLELAADDGQRDGVEDA